MGSLSSSISHRRDASASGVPNSRCCMFPLASTSPCRLSTTSTGTSTPLLVISSRNERLKPSSTCLNSVYIFDSL